MKLNTRQKIHHYHQTLTSKIKKLSQNLVYQTNHYIRTRRYPRAWDISTSSSIIFFNVIFIGIKMRRIKRRTVPTQLLIFIEVIISRIKRRTFRFKLPSNLQKNPVADEEGSRKYEKNVIGSESASCQNTSNKVKALEDRNHENDLIGSQSADCKKTRDRENVSEQEEDLTKTVNYKKDRLPASLDGGGGRSNMRKCEEAMSL